MTTSNLRATAQQVQQEQGPVAKMHVVFEDNNGALRRTPADCQAFGANGQPAAVYVGRQRYVPEPVQTPCDIAEDGVCEVIDCCRNPTQILEALEIGYDSAQAEAAQYHAAMAGYRPERHAEMDADVAKIAKAITAVKAALAQQEQEPVAWQWLNTACFRKKLPANAEPGAWNPLYAHPPRREWRSLTDDEISALFSSSLRSDYKPYSFARAIEAALKEKNHG